MGWGDRSNSFGHAELEMLFEYVNLDAKWEISFVEFRKDVEF